MRPVPESFAREFVERLSPGLLGGFGIAVSKEEDDRSSYPYLEFILPE